MRLLFLWLVGVSGVLTYFSCQKSIEKTPQDMLQITSAAYKSFHGPDCQLPDSLQQNCAHIDLHWPQVQTGPDSVKANVQSWVCLFMASMLNPAATLENAPHIPVDSSIQSFINLHQEWIAEAPTSAVGNFAAESTDTVLYSMPPYFTLQLSGYTYTGGAHGLPQTAIRTFRTANGLPVIWADLVTDSLQLLILAEQIFRRERADIFEPDDEGNPGFEFDETFPFKLPESYGLVEEGILLFYNHYEVAPYALGSTAFVITVNELGSLKKY